MRNTHVELEPVVRRTLVHCGIDHAWRTFTDDIGSWWPIGRHSVGRDDVAAVVVDGPGGRVYERWHDGRELVWAEILAWEPPNRLLLAWHPGRDGVAATEVEIRFTEERPGLTRLVLEHRGWERLGDEGPVVRDEYEAGWLPVLNRFKRHAD